MHLPVYNRVSPLLTNVVGTLHRQDLVRMHLAAKYGTALFMFAEDRLALQAAAHFRQELLFKWDILHMLYIL